MPWHTVAQGEFLAKIAKSYHIHDWHKIYDHPENAQLRQQRPDPNILYPGDRIFIPEPEVKEVSAATEKKHRFVMKRNKVRLKIVVKDENDQPLASKPYTLKIDEAVYQGTTDGQGQIEQEIPISAGEGELEVEGRQYPVAVGQLDPIEETSGVQARLHNLGYDCGPISGELSDETRQAIAQFQQEFGLDPTGELDDTTRNKLKEKHGC